MKRKESKTSRRAPAAERSAAPSGLLGQRWIRRLAPVVALVLLSLAAYFNSFADGFAGDAIAMLRDPRVQALNAQNLSQILWHSYWWPAGESGLYRPLTTFSILFNYAILGNGTDPFGYHVVNWLLHTVNVLLAFALVLRVMRQVRIAFAAAALWAVHPVLTEAVTNVAGRSDLLEATAVLGGLLIYLRSAEAVGWRRTCWLAILTITAAAGASSKESAVILPVLIALYEFVWWRKDRARALLLGCSVTLAAVAVVLFQRWNVLRMSLPAEFPFGDNPIVAAGFWQGRLTALSVLGRYLWLAVWPVRLSGDYSFAQIPLATGTPLEWLLWTTVAVAVAATLIALRHSKSVFFLASFSFLAMLPASNLLITTGSIMGERLLYLPLVGLMTIAALAIDGASRWLPKPSTAATVIFITIIAAYSVRTLERNLDWRDDHSLAAVDVLTSPNSHKVHRVLAMDLLKSDPSPSNLDRAVAEADRSVAILSGVSDDISPWDTWRDAAIAHLAKAEAIPCSGAQTPWGTCLPTRADASYAEYERAARLATRAVNVESASRAAFNRRHGTRLEPATVAGRCFSILGRALLHLGNPQQALAAALRAKAIDSGTPQPYAEIAEADVIDGHEQDAAVALAEGIFVTRDPGLRERLLKLYLGSSDPLGCAVIPGPNGPAINPNCERVRHDFCAAALQANRQDWINEFSCAKRKSGS